MDTVRIQKVQQIHQLEQKLEQSERKTEAVLAELSRKIAWNSYRNYLYLVSGTKEKQIIEYTLLHNQLGYLLRVSTEDMSNILYVWPEYAPHEEVQQLINVSQASIRLALEYITVPPTFIEFQNNTRPLTSGLTTHNYVQSRDNS